MKQLMTVLAVLVDMLNSMKVKMKQLMTVLAVLVDMLNLLLAVFVMMMDKTTFWKC